MKIYCIKFDTMPFCHEVLKMAKIMDGTLLRQVSGCFTTTTLIQMFTGKQPSDLEPQGVGYCLWHSKMDADGMVNWSWVKKNIQFYLIDKGFKFWSRNNGDVLRSLGFKSFPQFQDDSSVLDTVYVGDKPHPKVIADDMLGSGVGYKKLRDVEFDYIDWMQKPTEENRFYFPSYNHFHSVCECGFKENHRQAAGEHLLELVRHFDFTEPDSLFWFFSDHGMWHGLGGYPLPKHYYTWAIVKDNSKNPISFPSKVISAQDFSPLIRTKFGDSSPTSFSKDMIFFTEDGRREYDRNNSTTAVACRFENWVGDYPLEISSTVYHKPDNRFRQRKIKLSKDGLDINDVEDISTVDEQLKKALVSKFVWVLQ